MTDFEPNDELFLAVGELLNGKPTHEVLPVLITVSARALVSGACDVKELQADYDKFCDLLHEQLLDIMREDIAAAEGATKQ